MWSSPSIATAAFWAPKIRLTAAVIASPRAVRSSQPRNAFVAASRASARVAARSPGAGSRCSGGGAGGAGAPAGGGGGGAACRRESPPLLVDRPHPDEPRPARQGGVERSRPAPLFDAGVL